MVKISQLRTYNWRCWTYVDDRRTRHSDPYMVLVLEPKDKNKTAPTYGDIVDIFLPKLFEVEQWNDQHLDRQPQLKLAIAEVERVLKKFKND